MSNGQQANIELRPIADEDVPRQLSITQPAYAAERARADHISLEEASTFADAQLAQVLPQGAATPGHFFDWITTRATGERVGFVWYFVDRQRREGFIYDLWIDEAHRRQGYGSAALAAVGEEVRRKGCERIGLNVFETNAGAVKLYRKCGFQVVTQYMNKRL